MKSFAYDFRFEKIISPIMEQTHFEVLSKPNDLNRIACNIDEYFLNMSLPDTVSHVKETFDFLNEHSNLNASMNINYSMVSNPIIMNVIYRSAKKLKCKNINLSLELNENCLGLLDEKDFSSISSKFSNIGVDFWLDDFGCGSANFSSIINNTFSVIKIDKKIFWEFHSKHKGLLVEVINFIRLQGCQVVIEGIETKEQFEFSIENDCYSQGYFFNV